MPGSRLVQSLSRGLRILELVASSEDGMSLQQIANDMDLKPPTAHGLTRTLAVDGFLERVPHPIRYRLGPKMISLVDQYRDRPLQRRAARTLGHLHEEFPSVRLMLAQSMGPDIVMALRLSPERPGVLEHPRYSVMPAYTSVSSLVFQAFWQHEQRLLSRQRYPFSEYGAHAWETEVQLDRFLDQVRTEGYAFLAPVGQTGLYRYAVPIFSPTHGLLGALGLTILADGEPSSEPIRQSWISRLKAAAEEIANGHGAAGT